jgi:hypothetical protein
MQVSSRRRHVIRFTPQPLYPQYSLDMMTMTIMMMMMMIIIIIIIIITTTIIIII